MNDVIRNSMLMIIGIKYLVDESMKMGMWMYSGSQAARFLKAVTIFEMI